METLIGDTALRELLHWWQCSTPRFSFDLDSIDMAVARVPIPQYDGTPVAASTINDFLEQFEVYAKAAGYTSDEAKINGMTFCLSGDAKLWYNAMTKGWRYVSNWDTLKQSFREAFARANTAPANVFLFDSLSQMKGESVTRFVHRTETAAATIYSRSSLRLSELKLKFRIDAEETLDDASEMLIVRQMVKACAQHFLVAGLTPVLREAVLAAGPHQLSYADIIETARRKEEAVARPVPLSGLPGAPVVVAAQSYFPGRAPLAAVPAPTGQFRSARPRSAPHPDQTESHGQHVICDWCHGRGHIQSTCYARDPTRAYAGSAVRPRRGGPSGRGRGRPGRGSGPAPRRQPVSAAADPEETEEAASVSAVPLLHPADDPDAGLSYAYASTDASGQLMVEDF